MIRIRQCNSVDRALNYFTTGLVHEDYLVNELTAQGHWYGEGSIKLGLDGAVSRADFASLCRNERPGTDASLTARTKANRRVGWDIGFSVPKSFSLLYALGCDPALIAGYHKAVHATMSAMEADALARVRRDGQECDRRTGNMVWAQFVHTTARPVGGVPDPQLHAHCFVFNATHDNVEGAWKAVQLGDIRRDLPYYEALYMSRLAEELHAIGYETEGKGKFWEVKGVPREEVKAFSRRTTQVEAFIERHGIENEAEKAGVAARTRESKREDLSEEELRSHWRRRVRPEHEGFWERARGTFKDRRHASHLRDAVARTIGRVFEYEAVILQRRLVADVLRQVPGYYREDAVLEECRRQGVITPQMNGYDWATTRDVLQEERRMIELARDSRGRRRPMASRSFTEQETGLDGDRLVALNRLLASTDGVVILDRREASGHDGLLPKLRELVEQSSVRSGALPFLGLPSMVVLAPTREATKTKLGSRGFGDAVTVSEFLGRPEHHATAFASGIVAVEDAGKLGTTQMKDLLTQCQRSGARLILSGDSRLHRSACRGDCLRVLRERAGIEPVTVDTVRRQHGPYREAVRDLAAGRTAEGFDKLREMSAVREYTPERVLQAAAADYVQTRRSGRSVLVIAPRRDEGRELSAVVREQIRKENWLGKERTFMQLARVEGSTSDRSRSDFYQRGQIVQFHQNAPGFRAGSRWKVVGHDPFRNVVVKNGWSLKSLPLGKAERFGVFDAKTIRIAVGDDIRITNNGRAFTATESVLNKAFGASEPSPDSRRRPTPAERIVSAATRKVLAPIRSPTHDLNNGSVHRVKRFTPSGGLLLESGLVVPKDFGHIEHGYCWTSVKAQDRTADKVILLETPSTGRAASAEQFYSSVSCGRDEVAIYTTDAEGLRSAVQRSGKGPAAVDIMGSGRPGDDGREGTERARAEQQRRDHEHSTRRPGQEKDFA